MRRNLLLIASMLFALSVCAAAQSLGDVARQQRNTPKPKAARVVTNDDLKSDKSDSTEATVSQSEPTDKAADKSADGAKPDAKEPDSAEDRKKAAKEWSDKVEEQKKAVASLQREIDLGEREWKLRASAYYSDAGARLRDEGKWAADERSHQQEMDKLKKDLDAAQKKLADTQEQARKAGAKTE